MQHTQNKRSWIDRLLTSPQAQQLQQEVFATERDGHNKLVAAHEAITPVIEALEQERREKLVVINARIAKLGEELLAAKRDKRDIAHGSASAIQGKRQEMIAIESELRATRDPRINEFIGECNDLEKRFAGAYQQSEGIERNLVGGVFTWRTNGEWLDGQVRVIREVRAMAEALTYRAYDDLGEELNHLRRMLPDVSRINDAVSKAYKLNPARGVIEAAA